MLCHFMSACKQSNFMLNALKHLVEPGICWKISLFDLSPGRSHYCRQQVNMFAAQSPFPSLKPEHLFLWVHMAQTFTGCTGCHLGEISESGQFFQASQHCFSYSSSLIHAKASSPVINISRQLQCGFILWLAKTFFGRLVCKWPCLCLVTVVQFPALGFYHIWYEHHLH